MFDVVLIVLAAGGSTRLGQSKQLLELSNGLSLLQQTVVAGLESNVSQTMVVLGANYDQHLAHLKTYPEIAIIENTNWSLGMGSSIKVGLTEVTQSHPSVDAVIFSVCDQPHIEPVFFNQLLNAASQSSKTICVSKYNAVDFGVPVLFKKQWFDQLKAIPDENGALKLINQNKKEVKFVDFTSGSIDIDTIEDWSKLTL